MKSLFYAILCLIATAGFAQQTVKTTTFIVRGNCEECKEVIENAADIRGVKILKWSEKTKVAEVTFDTTKVNLPAIQKAIAAKGYDAGPVKGNDKAYKSLPKCCRYRDQDCEEKK
jgi:Cu(I)/Ag(I) efflux system membrane fusion protein